MGGIITKQKLEKIRREIESLRASKHNIKPHDLVSLAKSLGRVKSKRGKHPTYVSTLMATRNPLSIPGHPTIKTGTACGILDELESDVDELSALLDEQEQKRDPKRLPARTVHKGSTT